MGRLAQTLGVRLTTMPYFHVLISEESEPNKQRCIFHDLNENSLASNFLKPYKRGKNILSNGEIITLSSLRKIVISQTDSDSEVLLKRFNDEAHKSWEQDLNGSKGYVVLGLPFTYGYDDLANLGKNVTSQFISGAPSVTSVKVQGSTAADTPYSFRAFMRTAPSAAWDEAQTR